MKNYILFFFILFGITTIQAQSFALDDTAEVSILTMGPGDELYDSFGHSAFRIKDESRDIVYNYGTYDFEAPNFYTKFAQGKLRYKIDSNEFQPFYNYYASQNRWINEQQLNFTYAEKQQLFVFLETNLKPENQFYKYDFFYDNCATKIRDVLKKVMGDDLMYTDEFVTETFTFRELIHQNVNQNSWGSMGIDIALGAVIDREATPWEYQFLPEYVMKAASTATIARDIETNGQKVALVKNTEKLFDAAPKENKFNFFTSPLFIFGLIAVFLLYLTYKDYRNKTRSIWVDGVLCSITGVIGIFLLLLWFATDHTATAYNYNLLWAFPINLFVFFSVIKKNPKIWVRKYYIFLLLLMVLLTIHWFSGVQQFPISLLPFLSALGIRYVYVIFYLKKRDEKL